MIKKIRLQGLLSFEDMELELRNLNVLIGPNGSGKSNLIEALSLLQALPTDIGEPIRRGGGIGEWIRKCGTPRTAQIAVELADPDNAPVIGLSYDVEIKDSAGRYFFLHESLGTLSADQTDYSRMLLDISADAAQSALQSPGGLPELDAMKRLAKLFREIRLYRQWSFGGNAAPRQHQPADYNPGFLMEGAENLALVINEFDNMRIKDDVEAEFRRFYNLCERLSVSIFGNRIMLNMHEEGLTQPIPATRWSDGMIRYLCLLAILCHPKPPGLICIDEPDLGFHPDILPNLARLIKSASERTQIIITTHSAELVDQFTDEPESIVVCERDFDGATQMKRQDPKRLKKWLEDYSLGDLWRRGEIGGNPF